MATQLGFDLPVRTALDRDDFMVAPSNAVALSLVDGWRDWPRGKLVLSGPEGAGKTHLTHVWATETGARITRAPDLTEAQAASLFDGPAVIEDVPAIAQDTGPQTALFHLHNALAAAGHPLLLTGRGAPGHWRLSLPDLQSRIAAAGHAALAPPDDTLLAAVLAKQFADRQLRPRADVIPYLVPRMERSFAAARHLVHALDARSLATQKPITRAMAAQVLDIAPPHGG